MYNLVGLLPLHGHQAPITNYSGGGSPIWNWEPATGKSAKIPPILANHTVHRSPNISAGSKYALFPDQLFDVPGSVITRYSPQLLH